MVSLFSRIIEGLRTARRAPRPQPSLARRAVLRSFGATFIAVVLGLVLAGGSGAQRLWAAPGGGKGVKPPKTMLPLVVDEVVINEVGQLVALARVGNNPFQIPLDLSTSPNLAADADCPILNLEVGAIHLNLLGLNVDTSDICLDIIAHQGEGLLGDLLCGISNLLAGGFTLPEILQLLNPNEVQALLDGITDLLNEVFDLITSPDAVAGAACNILNLALGPVDLNLLGLEVALDDCNNGPVTVDVTAVPGGGLLGDLLCGLANLLNGGVGGNALKQALNDVANAIIGLVT